MIRKVLISGLCALLTIACTKEHALVDGENIPIRFGAGAQAETKAISGFDDLSSELLSNGFEVLGISEGGSVVCDGPAYRDAVRGGYFPARIVDSSEDSRGFVFEDKYYRHSERHDFFAFWPPSGDFKTKVGAEAYSAMISSGDVVYGPFSLTFEDGKEIDLLAARATGVLEGAPSVNLSFRHVMSQARICARGGVPGFDYRIRRIAVNTIGKGMYHFRTHGWSSLENVSDFPYVEATSVVGTTLIPMGDYHLFFPSDVEVVVDWDCLVGDMVVASYHKSATVSLSIGEKCDINITLGNEDAEDMAFTVVVLPWEDNTIDVGSEDFN